MLCLIKFLEILLGTPLVILLSPNLEIFMPPPIWRPNIFTTFVFHKNYVKKQFIKINFPSSLYTMFVYKVYLPRILNMREKICVGKIRNVM